MIAKLEKRGVHDVDLICDSYWTVHSHLEILFTSNFNLHLLRQVKISLAGWSNIANYYDPRDQGSLTCSVLFRPSSVGKSYSYEKNINLVIFSLVKIKMDKLMLFFTFNCRWNATFHDYSSHLAQDVDYSKYDLCYFLMTVLREPTLITNNYILSNDVIHQLLFWIFSLDLHHMCSSSDGFMVTMDASTGEYNTIVIMYSATC